MRVVLFDIDGTLLVSDGAGKRAIHAALYECFGTAGNGDLWFDGKTDRQIVRELLRGAGVSDAEIDDRMDHLLQRYLLHLQRELANPAFAPRLLGGVSALLQALEGVDDVTLGVLTGNIRGGAEQKLRSVGVSPERFVVGAFGSDHEDRFELPAIARTRAEVVLRRSLAGSSLVIIGDTPADLNCGRAIGARAIGVSTGRYTTAELQRHGPTAVFDGLDDTEAVVTTILAERSAG